MNITCPHCGQQYEISHEYIGKDVKCEVCGNYYIVENPNLAPCPDCFSMISKRAVVCPHCGAPIKGKTNALSSVDTTDEQNVFKGNPAAMYYCVEIVIGILLSPILIGLFFLLDAIINIKCTIYTVTTKRDVVKTGWLNKRQIEIWIKDMRGVNLQQDIWERIIGTGSVAIGTAATAGTEIQMHGLKNAQEIVNKINNLRM